MHVLYIESFKKDKIFFVSLKRFEFISGIGKTIVRYGQIRRFLCHVRGVRAISNLYS